MTGVREPCPSCGRSILLVKEETTLREHLTDEGHHCLASGWEPAEKAHQMESVGKRAPHLNYRERQPRETTREDNAP
jgi:hypothetical protein